MSKSLTCLAHAFTLHGELDVKREVSSEDLNLFFSALFPSYRPPPPFILFFFFLSLSCLCVHTLNLAIQDHPVYLDFFLAFSRSLCMSSCPPGNPSVPAERCPEFLEERVCAVPAVHTPDEHPPSVQVASAARKKKKSVFLGTFFYMRLEGLESFGTAWGERWKGRGNASGVFVSGFSPTWLGGV